MDKQEFVEKLQQLATESVARLVSPDGTWIVKGFIDLFRNVYVMPGDTKVISKIIELMLFPQFAEFAAANSLQMILTREQNHYPDLSFVSQDGVRFAVDLKTTYRIDAETVNTMTLGAYTGYFRTRNSEKNITFPYGSYAAHLVFGVIYSRVANVAAETNRYQLEDLERIPSVIQDLQFFVQPKYRIAKDGPGSGNTKNIGGVSRVSDLLNGTGPFAALGEAIFDYFWMFYLAKDMARAAELDHPPYTNLASYFRYKQLPKGE